MYQFIATFENMDNETDRRTLIIEYFASEAEAWEAATREALKMKRLNECLLSVSFLSA